MPRSEVRRSWVKCLDTALPPTRIESRTSIPRPWCHWCMRQAMVDAGLNASDIGYVNAHGTSTTVNDRVETLACKGVFGELAPKIPVSSTKSMMGHLIAAAGATEMIICLLAIRDGVLPPTINLENPDPECDLDYVPNQARPAKIRFALNNSFGFGGQNVTLAVGGFQSN